MTYQGLEAHILSLFQGIFPKIQIEYNDKYDFGIPYLQGFTYTISPNGTINSRFILLISKTGNEYTPIGWLFDTVNKAINNGLLGGIAVNGEEAENQVNGVIFRQLPCQFRGTLPNKLQNSEDSIINNIQDASGEHMN